MYIVLPHHVLIAGCWLEFSNIHKIEFSVFVAGKSNDRSGCGFWRMREVDQARCVNARFNEENNLF